MKKKKLTNEKNINYNKYTFLPIGGIARCHEPRSMRDKLIMSAPPNHFICTEDPDPQILAKCDACYTFPCGNGATCRPKPLRDYDCDCAPGFHGHHCEYKIDACFGNPCDNGGICKVLEMGRFSCHCPQGIHCLARFHLNFVTNHAKYSHLLLCTFFIQNFSIQTLLREKL